MDLQPSGNNKEIVFLETNELYFSIKANNDTVGISEYNSIKVHSCGDILQSEYNKNTYLKEYKNYELIIEGKTNKVITFYHENINIRNKITPTGRSGRMISGIINFKGEIGYSDLYVMVDGKEHLKVTVEIFPTKIDYKEDYKALLKDVNDEIYNLAYGFLGRTYLGAAINNKNISNYNEFYSILNYVYDKLLKSIGIIIDRPHHMLEKQYLVRKHSALKNSSNETLKWLEKRPHLIKNIDGRYIPMEALQVRKSITVNTNENKFLKFILIRIVRKIDEFIKRYKEIYYNKENKSYRDEEVIKKLTTMKNEIIRRINTSFLKDVQADMSFSSISLVFSMANGYRDVYKYYLMLQRGLNINSNILTLSMKDLPLLYEYWCFIKINSLLRRKYKLITSDIINVNNNGIIVSLKKGKASTLVYEDELTKEKFKVMYNASCLSKTVNQKPDNVISFDKVGYKKTYEFIFDAKYKIENNNKYIERYNGIGPKEEDINTMHRYRDAIVYENKKENKYDNCVSGAFVLFPLRDEENFREQRFYKSIDEVSIGAIPFLPSSTKLMDEFLSNIIDDHIFCLDEKGISLDNTNNLEVN